MIPICCDTAIYWTPTNEMGDSHTVIPAQAGIQGWGSQNGNHRISTTSAFRKGSTVQVPQGGETPPSRTGPTPCTCVVCNYRRKITDRKDRGN